MAADSQLPSPAIGPDEEGWEVLSDMVSVLSFSTVGYTYAEVVAKPTSLAGDNGVCVPSINRSKTTAKTKSNLKSLSASDTCSLGDMFDAHFCMEGVKGTRGGKTSLMFKGNPRTQKPRKKGRKRY